LSTIPEGTVLTLKNDHLIPAFEGQISFESDDPNYGIFNIVFSSSDKRRRMKAGTQFTVKAVELEPGAMKVIVEGKVKFIYFGEIKSRNDLKISALTEEFEVEFPAIEDF
jgi:hypothetical protein